MSSSRSMCEFVEKCAFITLIPTGFYRVRRDYPEIAWNMNLDEVIGH